MKHVHPPVKDGMCTTCHNPHDSALPKLLQQPLKCLCTSCHPDKIGFKYAHGPASTGDCHVCTRAGGRYPPGALPRHRHAVTGSCFFIDV